MTEEKAREFLRISDKLKMFNEWLEPFEPEKYRPRDVPTVGYRTFFRKGLKIFGYFKDMGYNKPDKEAVIEFDDKLQKYISDAVKKRRDEIEAEYHALANEH